MSPYLLKSIFFPFFYLLIYLSDLCIFHLFHWVCCQAVVHLSTITKFATWMLFTFLANLGRSFSIHGPCGKFCNWYSQRAMLSWLVDMEGSHCNARSRGTRRQSPSLSGCQRMTGDASGWVLAVNKMQCVRCHFWGNTARMLSCSFCWRETISSIFFQQLSFSTWVFAMNLHFVQLCCYWNLAWIFFCFPFGRRKCAQH